MHGILESLNGLQLPQEEVSLADGSRTKLPVPIVESPFDWPAVGAVACWDPLLPKAQEETTVEMGL